MSEQNDRPWIVKVFYLGMHDEVTHATHKENTVDRARAIAEHCITKYAYWYDDDTRIVSVPLNRVLRVEVYQL